LAREIHGLQPDATIWGTGGDYLRAANVEVVIDSSRWGVVGILAGLQLLPRILIARRKLLQELLRRKPDLVVAIDAGAFHLGFAGIEGLLPWLRRMLPQTRILYYFPPGSWRRTLQKTRLVGLTDRIATPFSWNASELRRLGVSADWVGHPLLDLVHPELPTADFVRQNGIDPERPVVGLLPGSRRQEITQILPVQLEAAAIIHHRVPGVQFLLALAPTVDREQVERTVTAVRRRCNKQYLSDTERANAMPPKATGTGSLEGRLAPIVLPVGNSSGLPRIDEVQSRTRRQLAESMSQRHGDFQLTIVENATYDVMAASDVLISTSGTATLEAAILGKPMVIMYRMSSANRLEYQFVKKALPQWVGMPNLLAERQICPEFLQDAATPKAISDEVIALLLEPERLLRMREDLRQAIALLGERGGAARAAKIVVELTGATPGNIPA
jgi:lipid A disaccharide synthetase